MNGQRLSTAAARSCDAGRKIKTEAFGRCTLEGYHAEVEFQKVMLPGDREPFLVPKPVTATLVTNKGNVVIRSDYEARLETGKR